jgi:hypothetical protein
LYKEVKSKYALNILVAAQALCCLLISFTILNLNILHIELKSSVDILRILDPLVIFHTSPFILFMGYSFFNLGKMIDDHKIIKYGVKSTFGLLYLSLGITIQFIYFKQLFLAAICFLLGLIATILLYSYSNEEFKNAKGKSRRKKKIGGRP